MNEDEQPVDLARPVDQQGWLAEQGITVPAWLQRDPAFQQYLRAMLEMRQPQGDASEGDGMIPGGRTAEDLHREFMEKFMPDMTDLGRRESRVDLAAPRAAGAAKPAGVIPLEQAWQSLLGKG